MMKIDEEALDYMLVSAMNASVEVLSKGSIAYYGVTSLHSMVINFNDWKYVKANYGV